MRAAFRLRTGRGNSFAKRFSRGEAPDTGLMGQNHLAPFGIEAEIRDSALRRRHRGGGVLHRLTWTGRELTIPVELRQFRRHLHVDRSDNLRSRHEPCRCPPGQCSSTWRSVRASGGAVAQSGIFAHLVAFAAAGAVICFAELRSAESLIELSGCRTPTRVHTVGLGVDERSFWPRILPPPPGGAVLAVGRGPRSRLPDLRSGCSLPSSLLVVLVTSDRNVAGRATSGARGAPTRRLAGGAEDALRASGVRRPCQRGRRASRSVPTAQVRRSCSMRSR